MTFEIALLFCIIAAALALLSWERLSADVVALGVLLSLVFTGLLTAKQAFEGFGSDTVIMILGLLLLTAALQRTGVVELTGNAVLRHAGEDPNRLLLIVTAASAVIGAFISNTASTTLFVPIVFGIAKKAGASPSKFLMPMAFASILTSSVTLVSTSTDMVVAASTSYLTPLEPACLMVYGPGHYRFLDFVKVGSILTVLIYLVAIVLVPMVWPLR